MSCERRRFLQVFAVAPALLNLFQRPSANQTPQNLPPPSAPDRGLPAEDLPTVDRAAALKHNRDRIRKDSERLFALAQELRAQVAETDESAQLSLTLVRRAGEIEKLAREIKNLVRG